MIEDFLKTFIKVSKAEEGFQREQLKTRMNENLFKGQVRHLKIHILKHTWTSFSFSPDSESFLQVSDGTMKNAGRSCVPAFLRSCPS